MIVEAFFEYVLSFVLSILQPALQFVFNTGGVKIEEGMSFVVPTLLADYVGTMTTYVSLFFPISLVWWLWRQIKA